MSGNADLTVAIHVWEDTSQEFDIRAILKAAGYMSDDQLVISSLTVSPPSGSPPVEGADTFFGLVPGTSDRIYLHPVAANYNGSFATEDLVVDIGVHGNGLVTLHLQVIIDPVNDAPVAADKTFDLKNADGVTLAATDFSFSDPVEQDNFKSIVITTLPPVGHLTLGGTTLGINAEVSIADMNAGRLVFVPDADVTGSFTVGFKVRDGGGTVGTGAADTSAVSNYLTFKTPMAHLDERVWEDSNGNGIHTIARADFMGSFDLLGNVRAIQSGWISGSDGFLAVDSNGNGKIDGISELFGGVSKGSGFAKLASYDSNGDGVVDLNDEHFGDLRIWRDANSNGVTDPGELMTLKEAGVSSLTVANTELLFLDARNNLLLERSSATLASGKAVDMTDVYVNVSAKDAATAGVALPSMADLLGNDNTLDKVLGQFAPVASVVQPAVPCSFADAHSDAAEVMRRVLVAAKASEVAA